MIFFNANAFMRSRMDEVIRLAKEKFAHEHALNPYDVNYMIKSGLVVWRANPVTSRLQAISIPGEYVFANGLSHTDALKAWTVLIKAGAMQTEGGTLSSTDGGKLGHPIWFKL